MEAKRTATAEILKAAMQILAAAPTVNARTASSRLGTSYKPVAHNSLGVGRKNRQALKEELKKQGLGSVEVDHFGRPISTSDRQRRLIARARGHIGMDSYYD